MKLLFENWRRYLNEGADPRIQKQLDALLEKGDVGVAIAKDADLDRLGVEEMTFKYVLITDLEADPPQFQDMAWPDYLLKRADAVGKHNLYGKVDIYKSHPSDDGECFDGYIVAFTNASRGWGPLLYEVAIEWASQRGGGLAADRHIVSHEAMAVWTKYEKRGDVEAKQMDISHDLTGITGAEEAEYPQLTPDEPRDDCGQRKAVAMADTDWADTPISKIYYKDNTEIMQALKAAGRLIVV